jgi:hypothetical protein
MSQNLSLCDDTDALGLRFDSQDDALDYASKVVQEFGGAPFKLDVPDIVESYRRVEIELVLKIRVLAPVRDPQDWYLVLRADRFDPLRESHPTHLIDDLTCEEAGANEVFMLPSVCQFVQTPEGVIPSLVWFKRDHEVKDFLRDVFASMSRTTLSLGECVPEGEVRILAIAACREGHSESEVVQCGPQIEDGISSQAGKSCGELLGQDEEIRLSLSSQGVRVSLKVGSSERFEVFDVRLGVIDAESGAVKGAGH